MSCRLTTWWRPVPDDYPHPRIYEPGTNVLVTTWKSPSGWILVRDALTNDAARARGLYRRKTLETLLSAPNQGRTRLGANSLWQLGVLEMWLQSVEG